MFDFSNFLINGALLRRTQPGNHDEWVLVSGPFTSHKKQNNHGVSISWPDFYSINQETSLTYFTSPDFIKISTPELRNLCTKSQAQSSLSWEWGPLSHHSFVESFETIKNDIKNEHAEKVVLSLFTQSPKMPTPEEIVQMILNLSALPGELHVFGFWTPQGGVLGATPEILFEKKGSLLKSMSLAGTQSKTASGDASSSALFEDPKELQEHQFVVESLKKSLSTLGVVHQSQLGILELPHLRHLQTLFDVELKTSKMSPEKILNLLHPTPALGAQPKSYVAQKMIHLPEQKNRWGFGSPITFFLPEDHWISLVTIRSLLWKNNLSKIGVGCGIVEQSQKEKEWNELNAKLDSVLRSLGMSK
jgi:isochorismate synthase EntC